MPDTRNRDSLLRQSGPVVYELHIPELRRPFSAILPCPERIYVAWHKDAEGIHELLDEQGHGKYGGAPQDALWEVREYERAIHYPDSREAFYEVVSGDA